MKIYRVLDVFAGAGGLSLGFLQTKRFEILAAFENNIAARETYKTNHTETNLYEDVLNANFEELSRRYGLFDVIIGGPPCQGFSNANRQHNQLINTNNQLIKTYVKFIQNLNPKAFLLENVKMLRSNTHRFFFSSSDSDEVKEYRSFKREEVHVYYGQKEIPFDTLIRSNKVEWPAFNITHELQNLVKESKRKLKKNALTMGETLALCRFLNTFACSLQEGELKDSIQHAIVGCLEDHHMAEKDSNMLVNIADALIKLEDIAKNNIFVLDTKRDGHNLYFSVFSYTVIDFLLAELGKNFSIDGDTMNSVDYGVPQNRERYIMIGVRKEYKIRPSLPVKKLDKNTVYDAIGDLYEIEATEFIQDNPIPLKRGKCCNKLKSLRDSKALYNHVATKSSQMAKERFAVIKQGMNFHSLAKEMIKNYSDPKRTQNSIYLRLDETKPSATVTNVRKAMWIHPIHDRAISVREAARLQSFPDSFIFAGNKDQQYQQVGNAVPPMLAYELANSLLKVLDQIPQQEEGEGQRLEKDQC